MLRASRWRIDPSWDEKHDIMALVRQSGSLKSVAPRKQPDFRGLFNHLALRWPISHRYAPSSNLAASLRRKDNYQGARVRTLPPLQPARAFGRTTLPRKRKTLRPSKVYRPRRHLSPPIREAHPESGGKLRII